MTTGYRYVTVAGRSRAEHRYRMEQHLGRPLSSDEHVHHINGNPADNRIENLRVMPASEHRKLHAAIRRVARGAPEVPFEKVCEVCAKPFLVETQRRVRVRTCGRKCHNVLLRRLHYERLDARRIFVAERRRVEMLEKLALVNPL